MERQQLEHHDRRLEALRVKLNGISQNGGAEGALADALDVVVTAVKDLIGDRLVAGEHAHAVSELIKRPGEPRMALGDDYHGAADKYNGPGSKVESGGKISEEMADEMREQQKREQLGAIAKEPDPRD